MSETGIEEDYPTPYNPEKTVLYMFIMVVAGVVAITFPLWGL